MSHRELLDAWFRRIWTNGDMAAVDALMSADYAGTGLLPGHDRSHEDIVELIGAFRALIEKIEAKVLHCSETGDWLCAVIALQARSSTSRMPVAITGQVTMRVADGKIAELYSHFDMLTLFEQIGLLPKDALLLCLSGTRIG